MPQRSMLSGHIIQGPLIGHCTSLVPFWGCVGGGGGATPTSVAGPSSFPHGHPIGGVTWSGRPCAYNARARGSKRGLSFGLPANGGAGAQGTAPVYSDPPSVPTAAREQLPRMVPAHLPPTNTLPNPVNLPNSPRNPTTNGHTATNIPKRTGNQLLSKETQSSAKVKLPRTQL